jgi:hypothetical protein
MSGFPYDRLRVFVIPKPDELGVSQVIDFRFICTFSCAG